MNLSVGIVGLPNVGKSTLFNALLKKQQALAANYPFATIEPNTGVVPVPDLRLEKLSEIERAELKLLSLPPEKHATVEFIDIAGIVKGASVGEGLGNKFLSHIREVSVIAHVVRAFDDENVIREGSVDTKSDYETINTELALADLETLSRLNEKTLKADPIKKSASDKLKTGLNNGIPARNVQLTDEEKEASREFSLLSSKPEIVVLNVIEGDYTEEKIPGFIQQYSELLGIESEKLVVISAKIEAELSELPDEDIKYYLDDLGLSEPGLERLIKKAYETLGLISFLTAGEIEVKAWTIKKGTNAQNASGAIHTDFVKNFIKAEVLSYDMFTELGGWKRARELGKSRMEGRDYIVNEGDVIEFKIGR